MHIDGFELLEKLGEGGMATVWKARQLSLDRAVAIKVLASRFAADPDDVARFQSEAQSAAKLKHPGIVQVYDAAMQEGFYYFVMELIDGYTVGEWMSRSGRLSEKDALQVAECVAEALGHAWEKEGIIHCDIKPDNIMIDADGTVKIADLGLARTLSVMSGSREEQTADILGTPAFMSPEQARGDMHLDCRSDIYSLGATLYYLVTGKYLFEGHAQEDVIDLQINGTAESPSVLNPRLSRPVGLLIEAMLAKDPGDRPKDWAMVRADLHRVRRRMAPQCKLSPGCASTVPPVGVSVPMPSSRLSAVPPSTESVPWLKLVIVAGAVILVIAIVAVINRPVHAPSPAVAKPSAPPPSRVTEPAPAPPAVDDTAFRDMFASAKQWAEENPDRYTDAIQQFRDVARQAHGTRFAGLANDEVSRLEAARHEAADAVMATLEQDVADLLAAHRYLEAAGCYRDYTGILADETQDRRRQAVERLEGLQRQWDQAAAQRQAEAERRAGDAWSSVSRALLKEGCVSALGILDGCLAEPLPEVHQQGLQAARTEIMAAAGVDARIMKSFEPAVGQDVTVDLTTGRIQLRLISVTSDGARGVETQRMGSGVIRVPVRFGVADLTVPEKLARMGADGDPGVPLVKGLLAYQSNALDHARNFFAAVPAPLGEHLLAAMDAELEAERREKAQAEAKALAEAAALNAGLPAPDVAAEPPVEDVGDRIRERDLSQLHEPGPFRALFQTIIRSNPMVADYEVEAYVDADNRLRRLDVISAGLKSLEPFGDLKDLRILYLGAVRFIQRHRDYQTAPVSDLAPLAPLRLETLYIGQTSVRDLSPLAGMPLRELYAGGTQVEDLTPLRGMPLEALDIQRTPVRDLSPLRELPLRVLNVSGSGKFHDFRPLQGMALRELDASSTQLRDLGILAGMPLAHLNLSGTRVHDFRVLGSLPLKHLDVSSTQIRDITLLRGQQLESLNLRDSKVSSLESLRGMPLKSLTAAGTMVRDFSPLENLPLADLDIAGCRVDSLSWVAGLPLRSLNLAQTGASDLSPLRGKELNYLNISDTKVRDLEELKFVSVRHLSLRGMKLDLTPLIGTKLERLDLDDPELFLSVLRRIQGLERINGMTIPELIDAFRGR